jgi:flagellar biosynthesis GTPase FlhF
VASVKVENSAQTAQTVKTAPGTTPPNSAENTGFLTARDLKPARARPTAAPALGAAVYQKNKEIGVLGEPLFEKGLNDLRLELGEKISELKTLFLDLAHRQSLSEKWRERGDLITLYRKLIATGLDPELARNFVEQAAESLAAWGGDLLEQLKKTILPFVRVLNPQRPLPRYLVFIGPTGSGKTTTLMKLATFLRHQGQKVAVISLDTVKLGAAEQLTQFTRVAGIGLKVSQSREEFREARELFEDRDHVLIDTSTRDFLSSPRKDLLASFTEIGARAFAVLPASLKTEDLEIGYRGINGHFLLGVILTKLDETLRLGNVINFIKNNGPIFAYFSLGPKAPEDFSLADPIKLLDLWLITKDPLGDLS